MSVPVHPETRRFTRGLSKPGTAAELRQSVSEVVRTSVLVDDYPLASLPLLGYSVTIPTESENIHKDYVFKLHFKSHVYYFRSESEYTFERWMEVIRSATVSASSTRILSRKEPHPY